MAVECEEKLCYLLKTVRRFMYLGDRMSAGGGCESAVTAGTCVLVKFRDCGTLLYDWKFPLYLKVVVYKGYVRSVFVCGSEA